MGVKVADIRSILSTRSRATFPYRINFDTVGYETLPKMNKWCEEQCKGLWRAHSVHALYWQFENDHDATMFMLKWANAEGNKIK